jgi:hypothetical protein
MTLETLDSRAKPDRFATSDEVRAALSSSSDFLVETDEDTLWEVPSDLGGHVLIETEQEGILTLLETLDLTAN